MLKLKRLIPVMLVAVMLLSLAVMIPSADTVPDGFVTDADGIERYYANGNYVTGAYELGGFTHSFDKATGEYLGPKDTFTNVGDNTLTLKPAYESALKSLVSGGGKVYAYYTFDDGEIFTDTGLSTRPTPGNDYGGYNNSNGQLLLYTKLPGIFSSNGSLRFQAVTRYSIARLEKRAEGGNALRLTSSIGTAAHCYMNINASAPVNTEIVLEAEYMLGKGYSAKNTSLFQLIDRKNIDAVNAGMSNVNYMPAILSVNPQGGVTLQSDNSKLVCALNENEFTRISVAVHPSANSFDVYVNGLLVVSGAPFITATEYKSTNFQIDELRTAQFSNSIDAGSILIDNVSIYTGSKPVSTTTAAPKNGAYLYGTVLRYYQNNLLCTGSQNVNGTFAGIKFDNKSVFFGNSSTNCGATIGNYYTVKINGNVTETAMSAGNVFVAPDAPSASTGAFTGWRVTDSDRTTVLSPGQRYVMQGDIICEAMILDYEMLSGASVRTTEGSTGIRFMARIDLAQYDALTAAGIKIEPHVLIVPTAYFEKTFGYHTLEALKTAGYTEIIDIKSEAWYSVTAEDYYYTGSVSNILPENYMLEFSGVAYLNITYPNGTKSTVYADYSEENNSRSVYRVAHAAYNDRTTVANSEGYGNPVTYEGKQTYSPYDNDKLAVIKAFADKVIMLESDYDNVVKAGSFYDAPYTVKSTFNTKTLKYDITVTPTGGWSLDKAYGVAVNGKALKSDEYTFATNCTLSVATGGEDIGDLKLSDEASSSSWLLFDASKDFTSGVFSGKNTNPTYVYDGQSASAKMSYSGKPTVVLSPKKSLFSNQKIGKYSSLGSSSSAYWDFSDAKAISFAIYSTVNAQTLQFNFHSENTSTDGIDYYGRSLKLNQGWNVFNLNVGQFSSTRTPLGWNHITKIELTSTGWSQTNSTSTVIYISNITAYDNPAVTNPISDARFKDSAAFYPGGYYVSVNGKKYKTAVNNVNCVPFEENGICYVPLASVAAAKGASGKYYADNGALTYSYGGKDYVFKAGDKKYTAGGVSATLISAPVQRDGALLFNVNDVKALFGYSQLYVDRMGLVVLSNTASILDGVKDFNLIYDTIEAMSYIRPSGSEIMSDFNEYSGGQHPYLMINGKGFDRLRYYAKMDETMKLYVSKLESSYGIGTNRFNAAVNRYALPDGQRLLNISRDVMNKTISWALLAKLYEVSDPARSAQYAERVWLELEAAANFKEPGGKYSWHPQHFLDTGELAYPFAICYDWLYDYWTKTNSNVNVKNGSQQNQTYTYSGTVTRLSILEDAMYWMGLSVSSFLPSDTTGKYMTYSYNLASPTNNWNGVCNGGLMSAALALASVDRYKENIQTFLNSAITAIESGMWVYAPEGGYEEGPGYWAYGTTYVHIFISCLDSACGTNYGLYSTPGFANSVYFTSYLGSANTTWGFHDGGSGSADTNIAAWFAGKSNDPNVNAIRREAIDKGWKGVSMYDLMYFDPHIIQENITLNLDSYYSLDSIMTFRSSWDTTNNIFAGLHGGDNAASHGDLDIGNFVINVNGTFIITELGSDSYNMPGYFGCYRWSYYRKRAEGQNTLVMIPSSTNKNNEGWDGKSGTPALKAGSEASNTVANTNLPTPDQISNAVSKTLRYESGVHSALGVIDMAPAFTQMTSGKRGMWMTDNRQTVILQDEAVMSENMDIWWFAHTQGEITVSADGRSAIIRQGTIYLYAEIVTDMSSSARFSVMSANSLDRKYTGWTVSSGYYTGDTESDRSKLSKLTVRVDDCSNLRLAVVFKVISTPADAPALGTTYTWKNIDKWTVD